MRSRSSTTSTGRPALDPKTGKPTINEAMKPLANGKTVEKIIPGLEGGAN
jgi:hypothetical protein